MDPPSPWKTPNEVMQLHKLKKRKKALQERMRQPASSVTEESSKTPVDLDFSRILNGDKRKNPFSKSNVEKNKKAKLEDATELDQSNDKTLFALLKLPAKVTEKPPLEVDTEKLATFSSLLQKFTAEHAVETVFNQTEVEKLIPAKYKTECQSLLVSTCLCGNVIKYLKEYTLSNHIVEKKYKHLTIDWALKTKIRLMSAKPFPWTTKLKASEEASGITGFVRCLDTASSSTLDTSPRARFHQTCLYWQHPHLPWLTMFPRAAGKVAATSFLATNDEAKQALLTEWIESFRSLFQLLRALHCPYFYVCANAFTCVFRAAGLCGAPEPCALIAPTTRGFRHALRQEDVEYTMPLRPDNKKKLNTSDEERGRNASFDSCYDTMDDARTDKHSGDEEDPDEFLSQMGLETDEIKRINNAQARLSHTVETSVDSAAESLVLVRGADAQALFNFLLNCKSIVSPSGPFGGVPPTLLAPTAFHGGTLQSLKVRENVIHSESKKYYSIELRGPILPTTVHSLFNVLKTSSCAQYSATFAHHQPTLAFTWAAQKLADDKTSKENEPNNFAKAFNKENLSDCGISEDMLQLFCSSDASALKSIDSVKYNSEDGTYSW